MLTSKTSASPSASTDETVAVKRGAVERTAVAEESLRESRGFVVSVKPMISWQTRKIRARDHKLMLRLDRIIASARLCRRGAGSRPAGRRFAIDDGWNAEAGEHALNGLEAGSGRSATGGC